MDKVIWVVGIVVGLIIVVVILRAAFRGMRPQAPDAQVYTPSPTTARPGFASADSRQASVALAPAAATPASLRAALPAGIAAEVDRPVASDQQMAAVKLLRRHTGFGLRESKDLIDRWRT